MGFLTISDGQLRIVLLIQLAMSFYSKMLFWTILTEILHNTPHMFTNREMTSAIQHSFFGKATSNVL